MYTQLGVMTKGTVIEVNVSELGMVTAGGKVSHPQVALRAIVLILVGKVVFGKYAQITNNPVSSSSNCKLRRSEYLQENDGCINAVLRKFACKFGKSCFRLTKLSSCLIYCIS